MNKIYCSSCGNQNTLTDKYCTNCNSLLKQKYITNHKKINNFKNFFTAKNKKLIKKPITKKIYNNILNNITQIGLKDLPTNPEYHPLKNVALIAEQYTKTSYKKNGSLLGLYKYNTIYIDDRLDVSMQISTVIHELAHHLFAEIFEEIISYQLNVPKSTVLEAFTLKAINGNIIAAASNEYSAHTTEGRFILHGCQDYGSYINIANENKFNQTILNNTSLFGNTMATDIISILENFIDDSLRAEIKQQYRKDLVKPSYDEIELERDDILSDSDKIGIIQKLIINTYIYSSDNKNVIPDLDNFNSGFKEYY